MTNFNEADRDAFFTTLNAQDVIASITLQNVRDFLESLGVTQIDMNEEKEYLICPTICHNPLYAAESMKLYWYHKLKLFRCYTECNEYMSIFELYKRFMALNYSPVTIQEAELYVKQFLTHAIKGSRRSSFDEEKEKYRYDTKIPVLQDYSASALDCFIKYHHPLWLKDGITPEAMDKFNIRFSLSQNKIIIPHYDINGRLIGIRGRALEQKEIDEFGKYRPVQVGGTLYTHQIGQNLYGAYEHQNGIRARRSAIIAEAEKSVLLDDGYYGEYSNCVACCGSSINKYHISILSDILGVNEVVIALDKEYDDWHTKEADEYRKRIEQQICNKYKHIVDFSYIWDFDNVLNKKDSPFDKGKDVFEHLYKTRVRVK